MEMPEVVEPCIERDVQHTAAGLFEQTGGVVQPRRRDQLHRGLIESLSANSCQMLTGHPSRGGKIAHTEMVQLILMHDFI